MPTAGQTDTLLLFQEDTSSPGIFCYPAQMKWLVSSSTFLSFAVASVSMKDLSVSTMAEVLEAHQFLQLPRLSSQSVLDALCPPEASRSRRRLCVTLITRDEPAHDPHRQALRDFLREYKFSPERVRFTYVLAEKQAEFVGSLVAATSEDEGAEVEESGGGGELPGADPALRIAILWRQRENKIQLEWLHNRWEPKDDEKSGNASEEELRRTLQRLMSANEVLPYEAEIRELFDEHAQSVFARIAIKMMDTMEMIRESVTKDEILPAVSLVVTVGLIMAGG